MGLPRINLDGAISVFQRIDQYLANTRVGDKYTYARNMTFSGVDKACSAWNNYAAPTVKATLSNRYVQYATGAAALALLAVVIYKAVQVYAKTAETPKSESPMEKVFGQKILLAGIAAMHALDKNDAARRAINAFGSAVTTGPVTFERALELLNASIDETAPKKDNQKVGAYWTEATQLRDKFIALQGQGLALRQNEGKAAFDALPEKDTLKEAISNWTNKGDFIAKLAELKAIVKIVDDAVAAETAVPPVVNPYKDIAQVAAFATAAKELLAKAAEAKLI